MPQWHGDQNKRKISGGTKRPYRGKKSFEMGGEAAETRFGSTIQKRIRRRGGIKKIKLLRGEYANVVDPSTKKTERAKIIRVLQNPVNVDYDRRKIITKSTVIETSLGEAVVTSHPGQDGLINAILVKQSG